MQDKRRVLVVDDDTSVAEAFEDILRTEGYEVHVAHDGDSALTVTRDLAERGLRLDVILLDLLLASKSPSLPLIPHLREPHPFAKIVVITGDYEKERTEVMHRAFTEYDVCDFLEKPAPLIELKVAIERAYRRSEARRLAVERNDEIVRLNQMQRREIRTLNREMRSLEVGLHRSILEKLEAERIGEHILEVGPRLLTAIDLEELLDVAVGAVQTVVPNEATVIFFREGFEEHDLRDVPWQRELSCLIHRLQVPGGELAEDMLERIGRPLANQVATSGQAARLPARINGPNRRPPPLEPGVHSLLCVPLVDTEDRILGVIQLFNRIAPDGQVAGTGFSETDGRVLEEIAAFFTCGVLRELEIGYDPLTRTHSRRVLTLRMPKEIDALARTGRAEDHETWFAILDVDHFGDFNKQLGHLWGDRVLRTVARTLKNEVREDDFVARFGGDEFCLILKRVEDEEAAVAVLERIRLAIAAIPLRTGRISASIGATKMHRRDTPQVLFERADGCLKVLKKSDESRNAVRIAPVPDD